MLFRSQALRAGVNVDLHAQSLQTRLVTVKSSHEIAVFVKFDLANAQSLDFVARVHLRSFLFAFSHVVVGDSLFGRYEIFECQNGEFERRDAENGPLWSFDIDEEGNAAIDAEQFNCSSNDVYKSRDWERFAVYTATQTHKYLAVKTG